MKHLDEELSAYISGELDEGSRIEVEAHLKECESCSGELSRLRDLETILAAAEQKEPSERFTEQVLDAAKHTRQKSSQKNRKRIAWLALAASAVAVILILNFYRNARPPAPALKNPPVATLPKKQEKPALAKKEEKGGPVAPKPAPEIQTKPLSPPEMAKAEKMENVEKIEKTLSPEEVELIANLDTLENMDLILNYQDVDHMETAVVANDEESTQ